jgi:hypothetical protein
VDEFARTKPPHLVLAHRPTQLVQTRRARHHISLWTYIPLLVALALRFASESTANLSFFVLAAYALAGRPQALRALALSWLLSSLNADLTPEAAYAAIGRYAVLSSAFLSMFIHGGLLKGSPTGRGALFTTVLLGLFLVLHSYFISPMVDVSILKAISWTVATTTIISAWSGLTQAERELAALELLWFLVFILLISLPLMATRLGYLRNVTGFQGILNHPQAFGPTMALLGSLLVARLLGERRATWNSFGLLGFCLFAVLASESRTAGLAILLAIPLAAVVASALAGLSIQTMLPGLRSPRLWTVIFTATFAGFVMAPVIADRIDLYITKSGRAEVGSVFEAYDLSRGRLIEGMKENIIERPFTGIGFGLASDPAIMQVNRDPVLGLPIGAPVEKGVLPLAILEEVGIPGALFVGTWLFIVIRSAGRAGITPLAVGLTALLLNFGEATLFSANGLGLLLLLFLGWGGASARRIRYPVRHD